MAQIKKSNQTKKKVKSSSQLGDLQSKIDELEDQLVELEAVRDNLPSNSPERKKTNRLITKTGNIKGELETISKSIKLSSYYVNEMYLTLENLNEEVQTSYAHITELVSTVRKLAKSAGEAAKYVKSIVTFIS